MKLELTQDGAIIFQSINKIKNISERRFYRKHFKDSALSFIPGAINYPSNTQSEQVFESIHKNISELISKYHQPYHYYKREIDGSIEGLKLIDSIPDYSYMKCCTMMNINHSPYNFDQILLFEFREVKIASLICALDSYVISEKDLHKILSWSK